MSSQEQLCGEETMQACHRSHLSLFASDRALSVARSSEFSNVVSASWMACFCRTAVAGAWVRLAPRTA